MAEALPCTSSIGYCVNDLATIIIKCPTMEKEMESVNNRIIVVRGKQVIIDRDVAELYGVETKRVNEALRNNPDKFPDDFVFTLQPAEKQEVVENFDHLRGLKYSPVEPHAFTKQGLYMLATILKSPIATETTIAIIRTFAKLRVLSRKIQRANYVMEKGGMPPTPAEQGQIQAMMNDVFADHLPLKMQKMTFGINLGFFQFKVETTKGKDK